MQLLLKSTCRLLCHVTHAMAPCCLAEKGCRYKFIPPPQWCWSRISTPVYSYPYQRIARNELKPLYTLKTSFDNQQEHNDLLLNLPITALPVYASPHSSQLERPPASRLTGDKGNGIENTDGCLRSSLKVDHASAKVKSKVCLATPKSSKIREGMSPPAAPSSLH